jgi:hypothetical protein
VAKKQNPTFMGGGGRTVLFACTPRACIYTILKLQIDNFRSKYWTEVMIFKSLIKGVGVLVGEGVGICYFFSEMIVVSFW